MEDYSSIFDPNLRIEELLGTSNEEQLKKKNRE
jgi:hypothetical protein